MSWIKEETIKKKSISPEGYDVVFNRYSKWFGVVIPKEMRDISRKYEARFDGEIPVIGFLVDPLGRIFFKSTDVNYAYEYIESGELNDFFSDDDDGGSSFCTLTTLKASFWEALGRLNSKHSEDGITEEKALRLIKWLVRFDHRLDRKLFKRHQMHRIGITKDGKNSGRMVLDPSVPTEERTRRKI